MSVSIGDRVIEFFKGTFFGFIGSYGAVVVMCMVCILYNFILWAATFGDVSDHATPLATEAFSSLNLLITISVISGLFGIVAALDIKPS